MFGWGQTKVELSDLCRSCRFVKRSAVARIVHDSLRLRVPERMRRIARYAREPAPLVHEVIERAEGEALVPPDWQLHEEYLKKKTVGAGEIELCFLITKDTEGGEAEGAVADGEDLGLKKKSPEACKKTELIDLILKSGVDQK